MNDLGTLATSIVTYDFPDDTGRFPLSYVSGWLEENIGELNGVLFEDFYVTDSGNIEISTGCGLIEVEESIFKSLYEIHFYEKMSRDTLRDISSSSSTWTILKEGDTTIQKTSKNAVAKTYGESRESALTKLSSLISKYNVAKSIPIQVFGSDGE